MDIKEKAAQMVAAAQVITVASIDENGYPRPVAMVKIKDEDGAFVQDCTMDEMIDHCIKYLDEFNGASNTKLSKEEAIAQMRKHFPTLKRWVK